MIVGKLKDILNYKGIHKNLDIAIDYIANGSWREEALGKTEVDKDDVFMNRFDYVTEEIQNLDFEAHQHHIDIHLIVEGNEYVCCSNITDLNLKSEYDLENDSMLFNGEIDNRIKLDEKSFVICFPEDAHMPKIRYEAVNVKKAVIKVNLKEV